MPARNPLTITLGLMRVINMAHGEMIAVGALVAVAAWAAIRCKTLITFMSFSRTIVCFSQ